MHTNFYNTAKHVHTFDLNTLRSDPSEPLRILRALFTNPEALRPVETPAEVTEAAASRFARLAQSLQSRGHDPEQVAHFLNRVLFCLFAEDVGLLPRGLMTGLIDSRQPQPAGFAAGLRDLFRLMAVEGGYWGNQRIDWFNGGLFDTDEVLEFTSDDLRIVQQSAQLDWSQVEPSVLGTLFERGLDPDKRGQLGAHYTDAATIARVVEPVVMVPLRREFAAMREQVEGLLEGRTPAPFTLEGRPRQNRPRWEREAEAAFFAYLERLRAVRVLDPACGSGNFLYVTLRLLKDLEKEAMLWGAETLRVTLPFPEVGPQNLLGIDINPYAAELARVSIWVGHIQWMLDNGFAYQRNPILQPLGNIECRDAILAYDEEGRPVPAEWPAAEYVVGNPPFLGDRLMRRALGDGYVDALRATYKEQVGEGVDLVCYWHEIAREQIGAGRLKRAGLLATNSIRGGRNRRVLLSIKDSGDIFMAWSDEPWIVEGAAVRVSIVAQDDSSETERILDGHSVAVIYADLTGGESGIADLTLARRLRENREVAFYADVKAGAFDVPGDLARQFLLQPANPNGRPNSDVVRPWMNALDVTRRPRDMFIVDFGIDMSEQDAAQYEAPFEYVLRHVKPARDRTRRKAYRERWWRHAEPVSGMRRKLAHLGKFVATPSVAKHRIFVWLPAVTLPDHQLVAIARDDEYSFGVLHSRAHERWSLRMGSWLGKGNDPRYTPTSTFETFPFPWPLNTPGEALTTEQQAQRDAIGSAARALNEARERWLNPPELVREEPDVVPELPPRLVPIDEEAAKELAKRTMTNLYNARPAWLQHLHRDLDAAVFASYGWPEAAALESLEDEEMLRRLLALNLERAGDSKPSNA